VAGVDTRLLPLFLSEDEISQEVYGGLPTRRSGELAAFVHAEQLLDVCRIAETLHRDNVHTVPRRPLGVVEQTVSQCVPLSMPAQPFSYPRPIALCQVCGTNRIWLRASVQRHQE